MGLSVNVLWVVFDPLSLNPHSLYHAVSMSRCVWILLKAERESWWRRSKAFSSAKSPLVNWSVVYRLNMRSSDTAP